MVTVHPEYVVDEQQNRKAVLLPAAEWEQVVDEQQHRKAVLLPAAEWELIVSELEELDDIRAYDAAQSHVADRLPFEQAVREIQQDCEA